MKIFAISDPHLSFAQPKPMDVFGERWENHAERMKEAWHAHVQQDDLVLIPGDLSWAMKHGDAQLDLNFLGECPGKKVILRGNHDYWWHSITQVRAILPPRMYAIQNDSMRFGNVVICGTRGWVCPESSFFTEKEDRKIYEREVMRLDMSIQSIKRQPGDYVIAMLHYPPFNEKRETSGFTEKLEQANVDQILYGHLHGKSCASAFEGERNGIQYHLVSCDHLRFEPLLIAESAEDGSIRAYYSRTI